MRIAIDIDGVVADLCTEWLRRYNLDYNDNLEVKDITAWDVSLFVKSICGKHIYDYLDYEYLYEFVKPIDGAIEAISYLREIKHDIVFVTASTPATMSSKYDWLKRYGFTDKLEEYIVATDKSYIRADIMIDDRAKNLYEFEGDTILFKQPWSDKEWGNYSVKTWGDVIHRIDIINSQYQVPMA